MPEADSPQPPPERGEGVHWTKSSKSGRVPHPTNQPGGGALARASDPENKPGRVIGKLSAAARRLIREVLPEGRIPIEELDERTIAYLILTGQRNRIRFAENSINPFNNIDIMQTAGYKRLADEGIDYKNRWPDQFERINEVLKSLYTNGLLDYVRPETAGSEYNPGYTVKPERMALLHRLAERAIEVSPRFDPKTLAPIKG